MIYKAPRPIVEGMIIASFLWGTVLMPTEEVIVADKRNPDAPEQVYNPHMKSKLESVTTVTTASSVSYFTEIV